MTGAAGPTGALQVRLVLEAADPGARCHGPCGSAK